MGIYLNPGKQKFTEAYNSQIYIDKTEAILYLNSVVSTEQKYVSVSRPRRFGKSMAVNMLSAYYGCNAGSRNLFEKTKLAEHENWDQYLEKFNVIQLTMTRFIKTDVPVTDGLLKMQQLVTRDIKKKYSSIDFFDLDDIVQTMEDVYSYNGHQFIILIDEWDAVFRERKEDKKGQEQYLDFLRDWLKDKPYVALAYITGILPIKKYGKHSALNMFDEYSMLAPMQLARYTGFTGQEVHDLCIKYGRDFDKIKEWYDGYHVSDIIPPDPEHQMLKTTGKQAMPEIFSLYSPLSVVKAISTGLIKNYWNKTETYEALAEYIRKDYDGLQDAIALLMDGGRLKVDLSSYQNDMTTFNSKDDVLALLIHLGYLGFDDVTGEVFIPNREILDEFKTSTGSSEWIPVFESFRRSQKLLEATWEMNADLVASYMEEAHDKAGNQTYNSEAALRYAIQYAYYAAQKYYTIIPELDTGKGYADVVFLPSPKYPDKPAMLVELKYDKTAQSAIQQIHDRNYPERLEHYKGNLLLVAVNYEKDVHSDDPSFKHHTCLIEKV